MTKFSLPTLVFASALAPIFAAHAVEPAAAKPKLEFRLAQDKPGAGLVEAELPKEGADKKPGKIYMHKKPALTEADIDRAVGTVDNTGRPAIAVQFTPTGGKKLKKLTSQNIDKKLVILFEGKVLTAPTIRGAIGDRAILSGRFTKQQVAKIVAALSSS